MFSYIKNSLVGKIMLGYGAIILLAFVTTLASMYTTWQNQKMDKLVFYDRNGIPHMRLDASQRCIALRGTLGRRVFCTIYEVRPSGCRRVEAGDEECLKSRAERGIGKRH